MKDTVLFYRDYMDAINCIDDCEAYTRIMKSIFAYAFDDVEPKLEGMEKAIFVVAKSRIDITSQKYEETIRKRSEAGKKGMESRWHSNNKVITNDNKVKNVITKITDNDNDNVNDNDNKYIKASKDAKPIKHKHGEYNNVLLTDEELEKLKALFPDWEKRIEALSNYIESKGVKYKSHFATIKNWARKEEPKKPSNKFVNAEQRTYDFDALEKQFVKGGTNG